jgi:hypothetical protein
MTNSERKEQKMGLDMYLRADKYVSGWPHAPDDARKQYEAILALVGLPGCEGSPSVQVEVTLAYWRKANHIHKWFVDHVQDGIDECQKSYVPREKLTELRDLCKTLLDLHGRDAEAAQSVAMEKLPPQSGFFFGNAEVDEWYWQNVSHTIEQLDKALGTEEDSFYYQSSW